MIGNQRAARWLRLAVFSIDFDSRFSMNFSLHFGSAKEVIATAFLFSAQIFEAEYRCITLRPALRIIEF